MPRGNPADTRTIRVTADLWQRATFCAIRRGVKVREYAVAALYARVVADERAAARDSREAGPAAVKGE